MLTRKVSGRKSGAAHGTRTRFAGLGSRGTTHIPGPLQTTRAWSRNASFTADAELTIGKWPVAISPVPRLGQFAFHRNR
jgi:hypothetical protein